LPPEVACHQLKGSVNARMTCKWYAVVDKKNVLTD